MGLDAYAFEPEYSEEELRHRSIDIDETSSINVLDMPVSEWCTCENCQIMDTAEECICCAGCEYVHPNIEDNTCITEHSLFELIVCNPDVLAVAFIQIMIYKGQKGRAPEHLSNK
ncbi:hypothetical protein FSP39_009349 [Pinctada imbricata]|uniref:P2X purinoreceptor 7 intracellular domain-containing protein n=1 Tax=Pinctada imbricata TaxID=66713 RepID=A0AA88YNA6_PINIB|nr:hypothetical protein FSP39_009349 [Pinctada imbricata]